MGIWGGIMSKGRQGVSLLEVLVVLGIIALLVGLLLPAVQRARQAALGIKCRNQVKQIVLAFHNFATTSGDFLPSLDAQKGTANFDSAQSPLSSIFPYLDVNVPTYYEAVDFVAAGDRLYLSPADPSVPGTLPSINKTAARSSYGVNAWAFCPNPNLGSTFPDGLSQTIILGEHYQKCGERTRFDWYLTARLTSSQDVHRASFADGGPLPILAGLYGAHDDVYPVTTGAPPTTGPSRGNSTFQHRPSPVATACDPALLQGLQGGGLLVGMGDGSVRVLSPGISMSVFWALVTPMGGEVIDDY
jgi:prepilin-type N-terminal cleavage/methylation domain-containing protein